MARGSVSLSCATTPNPSCFLGTTLISGLLNACSSVEFFFYEFFSMKNARCSHVNLRITLTSVTASTTQTAAIVSKSLLLRNT